MGFRWSRDGYQSWITAYVFSRLQNLRCVGSRRRLQSHFSYVLLLLECSVTDLILQFRVVRTHWSEGGQGVHYQALVQSRRAFIQCVGLGSRCPPRFERSTTPVRPSEFAQLRTDSDSYVLVQKPYITPQLRGRDREAVETLPSRCSNRRECRRAV